MLKLNMTKDINIAKATAKELVEWYNENSGHAKPIERFRDHDTAVRRCTELRKALIELSKPSEKVSPSKAKAEQKKKHFQEQRAKVVPYLPPPAPRPMTELEKIDAGLMNVDGTPIAPKGQPKRYESKTDPDSKYHNRERSTVEKPVAIVHRLCAANPTMTRKEIIALCIAQGVNKNTAATQYSLWKSGLVA